MVARGIGFGFGYAFPYLPKEFQKQLFARVSKNVNFADGIGQGLGFVFKYLSQQTRKQVYQLCNANFGLAQGLGFGIGFCFKYLDQVLKGEVFQRAEEDSAFAYGLAYGLGKTFRFKKFKKFRRNFEPRSGEIVGKPGIWTAMGISRLVIAVVLPFSVSAILLILGNLFDGSYTIKLGYTITSAILGRYAMMVGFGALIIGIIWLLRHKATKSWAEQQKGI
jgi:hypothetical protein